MERRKFIQASVAGGSMSVLAGCIELPNDEPENDTQPDDNESDNNNSDRPDEIPNDLPSIENGSFENDLSGWTIDKDLPDVPGGSETVDNDVSINSEKASDGDKCVSFYIEGIADDGTIWVEQELDLSSYDNFKVDVYSQQRSFNIISQVAFFAGQKPNDGLKEVDFDRSNNIEDHQGWKTYSYNISDISETVTVAVGMNVIWETEVKRLFDNVRLE